MSKKYIGGLITKTPVIPTTSSASGIWTLEQAQYYVKQGIWPIAPKTVQIKIWGAGGGYGNYAGTDGENGGPGGYSTATFLATSGTILSIFVGQGGGNRTSGGNPNGGNGGEGGGGGSYGGKGGGFTGVFTGSQTWANLQSASISSSNALIIAGSGGGGCYYQGGAGGGYGGGITGGVGMNRVGGGDGTAGGNGGGGSSSSGGSAGVGNSGSGTAGSLYKGGASYIATAGGPGGGGGAGWYGGGGAGNTASSNAGGGGGGSGMIASITSGTSLPSGIISVSGNSYISQTGTETSAPNNSDSDYVSGIATGGISSSGTNGGNGLIVIYIDGIKTVYSYTGNVQTITIN